jgi:hypothetical protein
VNFSIFTNGKMNDIRLQDSAQLLDIGTISVQKGENLIMICTRHYVESIQEIERYQGGSIVG